MSAHNVEIVRRIYEQISARQALPEECFHPDCVTDFSRVSADGGDGKVLRLSSHTDRDEALRDAGLEA